MKYCYHLWHCGIDMMNDWLRNIRGSMEWMLGLKYDCVGTKYVLLCLKVLKLFYILNLDSVLLCTNDNQLITYEKRESIVWKLSSIQMKILNDIACNLNWIELKFKNWIKIRLKRNEMQVDGERVWNFTHKYCVGGGGQKKFKYIFHASLLANELNNSNLKLSKWWLQLMESKVILPKLALMNCCSLELAIKFGGNGKTFVSYFQIFT
jgi:hypothetical protein